MVSPDVDPREFAAFEAAGWQRRADAYGSFVGHITSRLVEPMLDAAGVRAGVRVLDVATGPGQAAAAAAERGADVVGVDVAPAMVQLARRLHPRLDIREAAAERLPFGNASYDAVVGGFLLPHLARPEEAIRECVRVLRPGGRLALTTWDQPARARLLGVFLDAVAEAGSVPPEGLPVGPPFFRFADDTEFRGLLEYVGLTDVRVDTVAFEHPVESADVLWDGVLAGTVRTAVLIERQPDDGRARIRAAFDRLVRVHERDGRLRLPVSVKLGAGRWPGR